MRFAKLTERLELCYKVLFNEVNAHLPSCFPFIWRRDAKLLMTGEEILDAGAK